MSKSKQIPTTPRKRVFTQEMRQEMHAELERLRAFAARKPEVIESSLGMLLRVPVYHPSGKLFAMFYPLHPDAYKPTETCKK